MLGGVFWRVLLEAKTSQDDVINESVLQWIVSKSHTKCAISSAYYVKLC